MNKKQRDFLEKSIKTHNVIEFTFENKNQMLAENDTRDLKIFSFSFGSSEGGFSYFNRGIGCFMPFDPEAVVKSLVSTKEKIKKLNELWLVHKICIDNIEIIDNKIYLLMNKAGTKGEAYSYYHSWKKQKEYQHESMYGEFIFYKDKEIKKIKYNSYDKSFTISFIDKTIDQN